MILKKTSRLPGSRIFVLASALLLAVAAAGQQAGSDKPFLSRASSGSDIYAPSAVRSVGVQQAGIGSKYSDSEGRPVVDLSQLVPKTTSLETLTKSTQRGKVDTNWLKKPGANTPENRLDLQALLQHVPVAGPTVEAVTNEVQSRPQLVKVVRFLSTHIDPSF